MSGPINVSPYATNVNTLIDLPLVAEDGSEVVVRRLNFDRDFVLFVNGKQTFSTDNNIQMSHQLNLLRVMHAAK
jgi:hypothetical protein